MNTPNKYDDFIFVVRDGEMYIYNFTDERGHVTEMEFDTPGAAQNWIDEKRAKYNEDH